MLQVMPHKGATSPHAKSDGLILIPEGAGLRLMQLEIEVSGSEVHMAQTQNREADSFT